MLQNASVIAFTVSKLLTGNHHRGGGEVKLPTLSSPHPD